MTANNSPKIGAMLLAAGGSSRLGRPKQFIQYENETLLRRAARSLADSVYFPVVVVLGADADTATAEVGSLPVYTVVNHHWADGISSSIRSGQKKLLELEPALDGVLITLCDQPGITTEMLNRFAQKFSETNAPVIGAAYNEVTGVPAFFSRDLFDELDELRGDRGARQIIRDRETIVTIYLPEAAFDIDTPDDARRLCDR